MLAELQEALKNKKLAKIPVAGYNIPQAFYDEEAAAKAPYLLLTDELDAIEGYIANVETKKYQFYEELEALKLPDTDPRKNEKWVPGADIAQEYNRQCALLPVKRREVEEAYHIYMAIKAELEKKYEVNL